MSDGDRGSEPGERADHRRGCRAGSRGGRRGGRAHRVRRVRDGARSRLRTGPDCCAGSRSDVEEHGEELARLETANVGKPLAESRDEVAMVAETFYFYAGAVDKHRGSTVPVAGGVDMTFHEPLGVVAAIVPWNFPIAITSWKVAPGPRDRQHRRGQARRDHAADRARRSPSSRSTPASPKASSRWSPARGRSSGAPAGGAPRRGEGRLHRLDRGGPRGHGPGAPAPSSGSPSSSAGSRPRSSSPTPTSSGPPRRLPAGSSPTRARTAAPGAGCWSSVRCSTRSSRCSDAAVAGWTVGDPTDPATRMGPLVSAAQRKTVEGFLAAGMGEPGRRARAGAHGRRGARRPRLLVPADGGRSGGARVADGPRRDLRPGGRGHPLRRRGGCRPAGERHALRPVGIDLDPRRGEGVADGESVSSPATSRSTRTARCGSRPASVG